MGNGRGRKITEKSRDLIGLKGWDSNHRVRCGHIRKTPVEVLSDQISEGVKLLVGSSLLIHGSVVVIGSDMRLVVALFFLGVLGIGSRSESEVAASVHHVHGEGVVVAQEQLEFLDVSSHILALVVFSPVSEPPAVDLSSEDHPLGLEHSSVYVLLFNDSVVDADICSSPMALVQVDCCVHIVLVGFNSQIPPHLA